MQSSKQASKTRGRNTGSTYALFHLMGWWYRCPPEITSPVPLMSMSHGISHSTLLLSAFQCDPPPCSCLLSLTAVPAQFGRVQRSSVTNKAGSSSASQVWPCVWGSSTPLGTLSSDSSQRQEKIEPTPHLIHRADQSPDYWMNELPLQLHQR